MSFAHDLGPLSAQDVSFTYHDDAAWMAVVDLGTYRPYLPDWDYDSLTAHVLTAMDRGQLVAWGCPDEELALRLTADAPSARSSARPDAWFTAALTVTGELGLAGYGAVTMAAQFDDVSLRDQDVWRFQLPPGQYWVDVLRFFPHEPGEPYASEPLPDGDHYVVCFTRDDSVSTRHPAVPWT